VYDATVGVEFGNYNVAIEGKACKLQIWDTAGTECFRSITRIFYRNALMVFVVFDVTNRKSFESVPDWVNEVNTNGEEEAIMYLVGNVVDKEEERQITREEARECAMLNKFDYYIETSAKTGQGIKDGFQMAAKHIYLKFKERLDEF
jgi:small GTP-binding protein